MDKGLNVKGKAKDFFDRLFDVTLDPNPRPPIHPTYSDPTYPHALASSFDGLTLATNPKPSNSDTFVGGFHPQAPATNYPSPGPLPRPPQMPVPVTNIQSGSNNPVSLTMQHALNPNFAGSHANPYNGGGHHRPSASTSDLPSPGFAFSPATSPQPSPAKPSRPPKPSAASTPSTPAKTPSPSVGTSSKPTPTKPKRRRASSDITQSKTTGDQNRCAGIKKDGERCTRTVKNGPALASQLDDDESGEIERFCHQHSKEIFNGQSGFYARKNGQWLEFEDWIPGYLQPDTQLALRVEMEKARSLSEKPGYIYTFEIRDPNSPKTIKLKVGRAVNLNKRIDQWAKQCKSKEQVLRGWYPSKEDPDSLMKGRVDPGPPGGACHRLERLIHLELADLISSEIYLDPKWPSVTPDGGSGGTSTKKATNPNDKKCPDCGQMHKEIFEFTRVQAGHHAGREWESIVRPIVEKWGGFVDSYL